MKSKDNILIPAKSLHEAWRYGKDRQIPFDKDRLGITLDEIEILKNMGIVILHKGRYYMPEIIRRGLKFGLAGAGRPKVLTLLKRTTR